MDREKQNAYRKLSKIVDALISARYFYDENFIIGNGFV